MILSGTLEERTRRSVSAATENCDFRNTRGAWESLQHRFTVAGIKADAQKAKEGGGVYDPRGAGAAWYGTLSALCRPRVLVLHTSLLMVSGVLALASAPKQGQVKLGQVVPLFINWRMAMQSRARPSVEVTALSCLACLPVSHPWALLQDTQFSEPETLAPGKNGAAQHLVR